LPAKDDIATVKRIDNFHLKAARSHRLGGFFHALGLRSDACISDAPPVRLGKRMRPDHRIEAA